MKVLIEKETDYDFGFDYESLFNDIVKQILLTLNVPKELTETEVNVTLTNNESIAELNQNFRNKNTPTDVLSFPMMEYASPLSPLEDVFFEGENILGDIVISEEKCLEQAEEYGHSTRRELGFLFTHGMLHILGFDHINDEDRLEMEEKQRIILDGLGIKR